MRVVLFLTIGLLVGAPCGAQDLNQWPQFRGPGGVGVADETKATAEWDAKTNIKWKQKIPGVAWSCPIVWGDKVFVTTAITENQRKPRPGMGGGRPGGNTDRPDGERPSGERRTPPQGEGRGRGQPPDVVYRWEVLCLDRSTGDVLWKQLAHEGKPRTATHSSNTYASETPVTDGERVYAYFGMTGLYCFDIAGKPIWKKDLGSYRTQSGWGTASSPVLDGDRLFVQCDNDQESFLVAFDKKTGEELWRVPRAERSTWGTPYVWRNKSRTELVCPGSQKVRSYDPATGKVLWELGVGGGRCTSTPVGDQERLYVGLGAERGGAGGRPGRERGDEPERPNPTPQRVGATGLYAVRAGATGDITLKPGETSNAGVAWWQSKGGPSMASPLVYRGHVYVVDQRGGMVNCYDAKTGEPAYVRERIAGAREFWASPWAVNGKIFCLDDAGQTFVLQAGCEFKVLGKNALDEMCWATPALTNDSLFVRGVDHLYCIKP